jgi:P2-related tail formation protein
MQEYIFMFSIALKNYNVIGRHIVYAGYTKKVHRVMNESKTQKFIELWTNKKQTGDSALVQSKGTKTIYINSIRIMNVWLTTNA